MRLVDFECVILYIVIQGWDALNRVNVMNDEPTFVISGRVPPRVIERALLYFRDIDMTPQNKSDLVALCFHLAAEMARGRGISGSSTNHEAIESMALKGIDWPGEKAKRDIRKARQFDILADMEYQDAMALKKQIMDQRKKGEDLMPSASTNKVPDEIFDGIDELDKELRKGEENERT